MTARGWILSGLLGLCVICAGLAALWGLWPSTGDFEEGFHDIEAAIAAKEWERAIAKAEQIYDHWQRVRFRLSINASQSTVDDFDIALRRLIVQLHAEQEVESLGELAALRSLYQRI